MQSFDRGAVNDLICLVTPLIEQGTNPDITTDPVWFAVVPGLPGDSQRPTSWFSGFWLRDLGGTLACCTIGPGTDPGPFKPGYYTVWIRLHDNPTAPQQVVDTLQIT